MSPDSIADDAEGAAEAEPLRSDTELAEGTVGPLVPHDGSIGLSAYDPDWPLWFAREARRIGAAVGDAIVMLEHVGSTSVPGLAAKPRIDILLIVPDSNDESAYCAPLEAVGYVLAIREPEWHRHRVFKGPDTDTNVHVFSPGCSEILRMIGFRDWLRSHPDDLARYERTKRDLAGRTWRHVQHYADAKTAVVEEINGRAGLPGPFADGGTR